MMRNGMIESNIQRGLYFAGVFNIIGILSFSRGLTNEFLTELDPAIFGMPGIILVCVWGLAYIALAPNFQAAPTVALVFALEKLVYVVNWIIWLMAYGAELGEIWAEDWMTGMFYSIYGPLDALFGIFFVWVWVRHRRATDRQQM